MLFRRLATRSLRSQSIRCYHPIRTASCVIIGDEVLNGKIKDTNSHYLAKYCFDLGINLQSISVVGDDEHDIIRAVKQASECDFVVTSGGIGPTHDDITYPAIAKAFNLQLDLHQPTVDRMAELIQSGKSEEHGESNKDMNKDVIAARMRMAMLPTGQNVRYMYTKDMWVPIVSIESKIYILPGIPQLFERLLQSLKDQELAGRVDKANMQARYLVQTELKESVIAPFLSQLQKSHGNIKIGCYPHLHIHSNTVSIIGPRALNSTLRDVVRDVERNVNGKEITAIEEEKRSGKN